MTQKSFTRYAYFVIWYVVAVIMWGAFVRATGSGAGCGEHWPTCNGQVLPRTDDVKMMIEFSHRVTSGVSLICVLGLVWFSKRLYPKTHAVRRAASWSFAFICGEAAVGAMLVLLALVANNDSVLRALVIALHLLNTFLLLYWLVYTAESSKLSTSEVKPWPWKGVRAPLFACLVIFCITGSTGAIVALGDTLFPSASLAEGLAADFSPATHFLIRLRVLHPVIAVLGSVYMLIQLSALPRDFVGLVDPKRAKVVTWLLLAQLAGGVVNVILLAPVPMQMFHLVLADITWIALVALYFDARQRASGNFKETEHQLA